MRLRNGKLVVKDFEKFFFEKLDKFKKIMEARRFYITYFTFEVPDFLNVLNQYLINVLYVRRINNNKYSTFLNIIPDLEKILDRIAIHNMFIYNKNAFYIYREYNIPNSVVISLINNTDRPYCITNTTNNAENCTTIIINHKNMYKKEIYNLLCRLSYRLNTNIARHIQSFFISI